MHSLLRLVVGLIGAAVAFVFIMHNNHDELQFSGVRVYVDNGSDEKMTIRVDGKEQCVIEPGEFAAIQCDEGDRHFQAKCGDKTIYDAVKNVQPVAFLVGGKYLLNPDGQNRYRTYEVEYSSSSRLR